MNVNKMFDSKHNQVMEYLDQVKPYQIKRIGIKGYPKSSYICPKRNEFGLSVYGEKGCLYCSSCGAVEQTSFGSKKGHNVYCCFPREVNQEDKYGHPGYGKSYAPYFK